ncbi:SURF1 family protein [Pseudomonas sp. NPDC089734]|uniref:SURF1 family protein n=1 Tax=Pseudomonas sp. NPDC089734 TaxID=3364469 RepID=UPI0037FB3360
MKRLALRPVPALLVLALLPLLVMLGVWQLGRAEEKRAMLKQYAERRAAEPIGIGQLSGVEDPAYRRVRLQGHFDAAHSLWLDNRTREGQAGVELFQPFLDQPSGMWSWVNRGWLPWPDRRTLPVFTTPGQSLELNAWVYVPPGAGFQGHADAMNDAWPRLVSFVAPASLWAELGRSGYAHELRLEPGVAAYRVDWPVVAMGPEKHVGYAVQWFALSAALSGLSLYLALRGRTHEREQP